MSGKIVIPCPLMSLNEYIKAERGSLWNGAKIKKQATATVELYVNRAMQDGVKFDWGKPLHFDWYWYDKRTDPDNIAFQKKFVFDGMMKAGFLDNDNWKHFGAGFIENFHIDKINPRVEIAEIEENR